MTLASEIAANIPIYPTESVRSACGNDEDVHAFMAEWHLVFLSGAGIVVFLNAYNDLRLIYRVSDALNRLIDEERKSNVGRGDHFAVHGSNSRLWSAREKLCMADPEAFAL